MRDSTDERSPRSVRPASPGTRASCRSRFARGPSVSLRASARSRTGRHAAARARDQDAPASVGDCGSVSRVEKEERPVQLAAAALEEADLGDERFDKVFAFNVAPFWLQPKEALGTVRRHLAPDGAVYLFWGARHTQPGRARDLADRLSEKMRLAGFAVNQVMVKDLRPVPAVCVIGQRPHR